MTGMSHSGRMWEFVKRNLVSIVVIPSLVLIHWGWAKLQDVEVFVKKEEKKDLPIIEGARYLTDKFTLGKKADQSRNEE